LAKQHLNTNGNSKNIAHNQTIQHNSTTTTLKNCILVHPQPITPQPKATQKTTQTQKPNHKQTKPKKHIKTPQPHKTKKQIF
jgi:hypothetical protein